MISFLLVILVCSAHVGILALLLVLWTIVDVAVHKLVLALSLSASLSFSFLLLVLLFCLEERCVFPVKAVARH